MVEQYSETWLTLRQQYTRQNLVHIVCICVAVLPVGTTCTLKDVHAHVNLWKLYVTALLEQ